MAQSPKWRAAPGEDRHYRFAVAGQFSRSKPRSLGELFRAKWRAMVDEDGHYCFAVARYDATRGSTRFLAGQRRRCTEALRLLRRNAQSRRVS
jgi:hypothetical protein